MKTGQWVHQRVVCWRRVFAAGAGLLAAVTLAATPLRAQDNGDGSNLSTSAAQVLQMAESSVTDDVLLAYIQNSAAPFNLTADNVTYLRDTGVSSQVIDAMMNRDKVLLQQPVAAVAPAPVPVPAPAVETPPAYASDAPEDVTYFYSDLSPYGSWVDLAGYGWCWQPTAVVVNTGWRPYCNGGHWTYTDQGWFWDSDYSWGWAPFHYGRWFHHDRVGWVWFPDRVWGPAWVTWRMEADHCGWAPLPLNARYDRGGLVYHGVSVGVNFDFGLSADLFTFVGFGDLEARDLARRRLPHDDVVRIYNRTTVINDYRPSGGLVVNHGIPVDRVTAVTHRPIRPVPIHDAPAGSVKLDQRSGVTAGVFRREVHAPARPVVVQAQRVDDRHPVVQHITAAPVTRDVGRGEPSRPAVRVTTPPTVANPAREEMRRPVAPAVSTPTVPVKSEPSVVHGRSIIAAPPKPGPAAPDSYIAKPEDSWKPPTTPAEPAKPNGPFDYQQRIQKATTAHTLAPVPEPAHVEPPASTSPAPSTVTHSYTPRIQNATAAHELPAQKGYVPPTSIFKTTTPSPSPSAPPSTGPGRSTSSPPPASGSSGGGRDSGGGGPSGPGTSRDNGGRRGR